MNKCSRVKYEPSREIYRINKSDGPEQTKDKR